MSKIELDYIAIQCIRELLRSSSWVTASRRTCFLRICSRGKTRDSALSLFHIFVIIFFLFLSLSTSSCNIHFSQLYSIYSFHIRRKNNFANKKKNIQNNKKNIRNKIKLYITFWFMLLIGWILLYKILTFYQISS